MISEFRVDLIRLYTTTKHTVSVSPLREGHDKPISDIFVPPKLTHIKLKKDGSRKKTRKAIQQYNNLFFKHEKLNSRVFIQGEPGIGKTTFLTKLALDWCNEASLQDPDLKATFSDADTLKTFQFLFHISLRDAKGQRRVVDMIKTQIIDLIYTGDKSKMTFKLLHQILEREICIVSMDGLNEWADPRNKCTVPVMANCHTKCVSLITARPWKMADKRIKDSEIDRLLEIEGITDPEKLTKHIIFSLQCTNQKTLAEFIEYVNARQLMQCLTSPWMQTLLVSLWMYNKECNGSMCELNCILLDLLFKKANGKEGYFKKGTSFQCFSNTSYIEPQNEIVKALAEAAFHFAFSSDESFVFSKVEIRNYMSEEQLQFCLDAGLLTIRLDSTVCFPSPLMYFLHETIQEFLAAYYIANSKTDVIESVLTKIKYNVLEKSQVIIYLCGLDFKIANKLINRLTNGDFSVKSRYTEDVSFEGFAAMKKAYTTMIDLRKGKYDQIKNEYDLSVLFQRMMIAGFIEAKASGQKDICLTCRDFIFSAPRNEAELDAQRSLLILNKSNVRTLDLKSNNLQRNELLTVLQHSRNSIMKMCISTADDASLASDIIPSFSKLEQLELWCTSIAHFPLELPVPLKCICLLEAKCSSDWLCSLLIKLSAFGHPVECEMWYIRVQSRGEDCGADTNIHVSDLQSKLLSCDMSNIKILISNCTQELLEVFRHTSIRSLRLTTDNCILQTSDTLSTLSKLEYLWLDLTYTGHCSLQLPTSLQRIEFHTDKFSSDRLCSLLITLSALDHRVECDMWNFEEQSRGDDCGADSKTHVSDLRSKLLYCNMSNIDITVHNVSKDLFEIFLDTSVRNLSLANLDCISQTSDIFPTLSKLEELQLCCAKNTGHCAIKLPASLKRIHVVNCECSSEWLCSLLLNLAALDHPVTCALCNVEDNSREVEYDADSNIHVSELISLRSKLLSCDLSYLEILVKNGWYGLFEIFRDTSIRFMGLTSEDYITQSLDFLPTLSKLENLQLSGTYTGRCTLQLPASLQCISLQTGECSSEWLCSLLMKLSALDHHVKCEFCNFVVQSGGENFDADSDENVSDLRSKLLSSNLSYIEISVDNGSKELFEILRGTNIVTLDLRTADCIEKTSDNLTTLSKLKKLRLWGTHTGRCALQLSASLKCISLQTGECSTEWLCSLLIKLSALEHPVKCELCNFVVQLRADDFGADFNKHDSDLRYELLSCDMSNIDILVNHGSKGLFEILRDTSIGILDLRTSDCIDKTSDNLTRLSKLRKLRLWGTYSGRCALQLSTSFKCISLQTGECSTEWLCSLLIKLSELDHHVKCELCNFVVISGGEVFDDDSNMHVSDLRSKLLSSNLSYIEISVVNTSKELFDILRDTSIVSLDFRTADCIEKTSDHLTTLGKLKQLLLSGIYTGRCSLQLPASLQCIILQTGECSSEWLCSLLIELSAFDHPVQCQIWDFVVQSHGDDCGADSNKHLSDLRSKVVLCDMSNIELLVDNGSKELFEIFRDTSIRTLDMRNGDFVSQTSDILPTLSKLETLCLMGTYTGRCCLQLPASLQCISLQEGSCTSEWLCSLLITLSALDHPVTCALLNSEVESNGEDYGIDTNMHLSDMRCKLLECNMSHIHILVQNGNKQLFELFRDTSIGILDLRTANCISQTSENLPTLSKLKKLVLWGSYTGVCALRLPESLQCISLQTGECSSDWLCNLLIELASLDHPVEFQLCNFVVRSYGDDCGADSNKHVSDLRSRLVLCDMSNIELLVDESSKELFEILRDTNVQILDMRNADFVSQTSDILPTLSKLKTFRLIGTYTGRCYLQLPVSLQCISLQKGSCTSEWLCSLLITLSAFDHQIKVQLWNFVVHSREDDCIADSNAHVSDLRSKLALCDMSNIEILVKYGNKELFEIFRDTSIRTMDIRNTDCVSQTSDILPTLCKLETLWLMGTYTGRCCLQLPASLQCISLQEGRCTSDWLCSLLITLSALDHPVKCALLNLEVEPNGEDSGIDTNMHLSDMRCKLLECNMSHIHILVQNGNKQLFEVFRDTSIGILDLRTANCISQISENLPTLSKLQKLVLWGSYTGVCALRLPESLQCISFQTGECSSDWLCNLLIELASLDHPVEFQLWNFVVRSYGDDCGADSNKHVSDLRSRLVLCDLSNIQILVKSGSKELFKIFSDTSIRILDIRSSDCVFKASDIFPTLCKLETVFLMGTYTSRCDLQLPASIQCISLQTGECSLDWLCSLLIKLSELNHPVECQLWNFVVQSRGEDCSADSNVHVSELRSKLLSCDLSNIAILVEQGSKELFEVFLDTSIGILNLRTADCIYQSLDILPTLRKLKSILLWGTYTGLCALQLPASLQCISLQRGECSFEWLCSLLIKLSALSHPVECQLWNFVVQSRGEDCSADSNIHVSNLRYQLVSCDLSNILIFVKNYSHELVQICRETNIRVIPL
ncbi:hypothetical protein DPMN_135800 [Dreissena polymorpha]|uniref:NACHT domain-containing protein n=1 Tax=Dreissena polymorpha TaxID=45954 RepID=A0A9D4FYP2_DREPO|nr:hypothetical protein DPMN_135800 [Dreissena polymorpha]